MKLLRLVSAFASEDVTAITENPPGDDCAVLARDGHWYVRSIERGDIWCWLSLATRAAQRRQGGTST